MLKVYKIYIYKPLTVEFSNSTVLFNINKL